MMERKKKRAGKDLLKKYQPGQIRRCQKGIKYTYDVGNEVWSQEPCSVLLDDKPLAEGGMRWCVKMTLIDSIGIQKQHVAKIFKPEIVPPKIEDKIYFDEAMTQTVAESFARLFNSKKVSEHGQQVSIKFLPVSVVQLIECEGRLINVEPLLEGKYVKHNDNDGNVESKEKVPQAFSHFTHHISNRRLLVCDIQGVGTFYTDPQIHSIDGKSFGIGNIGREGILSFFNSHQCNDICKQLGLLTIARNLDDLPDSPCRSPLPAASRNDKWTAFRYDNALNDGIARATKLKTQPASPPQPEGILEAQTMLLGLKRRLLQSQLAHKQELLQSQVLMGSEVSQATSTASSRNLSSHHKANQQLQELILKLELLLKKKQLEDLQGTLTEKESKVSAEPRQEMFTCKFCGLRSSSEYTLIQHGAHHLQGCPRRADPECDQESVSTLSAMPTSWTQGPSLCGTPNPNSCSAQSGSQTYSEFQLAINVERRDRSKEVGERQVAVHAGGSGAKKALGGYIQVKKP
mmetsp:Transcript_34192/g.107114  ORF Transcript_34192/g.107114 Transcript_34192/m.107114 type:complete len:516 (-) Transcript_34192:796-2343(-)